MNYPYDINLIISKKNKQKNNFTNNHIILINGFYKYSIKIS